MPRRPRIERYAPPVTSLPDVTPATPETRRARRRAEYGATVNTNANRKNGGGATWGRVSAEYLAGSQRVNPPTQSAVKTRDDYGTTLPSQHLIRVTDEDTWLRTKARTDAERRSLTEYR